MKIEQQNQIQNIIHIDRSPRIDKEAATDARENLDPQRAGTISARLELPRNVPQHGPELTRNARHDPLPGAHEGMPVVGPGAATPALCKEKDAAPHECGGPTSGPRDIRNGRMQNRIGAQANRGFI